MDPRHTVEGHLTCSALAYLQAQTCSNVTKIQWGEKPTPDVYQVNHIIPISDGVELAILGTVHKHRGRSLDGIEVWFGIRAGLEKEKKREEEEGKEEGRKRRRRRMKVLTAL